MRNLIFKSPDLTLTRDFIILPSGEHEAIPINAVTEVTVSRTLTGDYKSGAVLFFILGVLSIWFFVGFIFIALGLAAWNTNTYSYDLYILAHGERIHLATAKKKGGLKDIARTINGLSLSKKILTFAST